MIAPWMLSVYASELNFFLFPPCLILKLPTDSEQSLKHARLILAIVRFTTAWMWLLSVKLTIGSIVLAGIALVAHTADAAIVVKATQTDNVHKLTHNEESAYVFSHLSIVNFVLDIPGAVLPRLWWQHVLIVLANVIGGLIVFVGGTWMYDYALAWSCYSTTRLKSLDCGYCHTFYGAPPPRCICSVGNENPAPGCGRTTIDTIKTLHPVIHIMIHLLLGSFALYVSMIPTKIKTIAADDSFVTATKKSGSSIADNVRQ